MKFWNEICRNESLHTLIKVRFSFSGLSTFWGIRHTQLSAVIENPLFHITLQGATLASGRPLLAHKASGKSYSFPPDSLAELSRDRKDHSWEMFLYFCCYCFKYQFITCILTTIKIRIFWQKNFSSKVFGQLSLNFHFDIRCSRIWKTPKQSTKVIILFSSVLGSLPITFSVSNCSSLLSSCINNPGLCHKYLY